MTTLSVVQFNPTNVLQQNNNNNNTTTTPNNNNRGDIIILRKSQTHHHHILPQPKDYSSKEDILITNKRKTVTKLTKDTTNTSANKTNPQPLAVARRNARERNRVKQVNNGFANLRQHIPNFIAATFESNSGRNGNKKLSKVETLRMAVEYIRSLEDLLASSDDNTSENLSNSSQSSSGNVYHYQQILSPSADEDDLSTNPTPPPPSISSHLHQPTQYIRINTSNNTYQIIPGNHHLYDDSENLEPLNVDEHILADPSLMDADMEFSGAQDLSLLNSESLSDGIYSEQSLSPGFIDKNEQKCCLPVTVFNNNRSGNNDEDGDIKIKSEDGLPVISLKTEHELVGQESNVIDVIQWWEQQQPPGQQPRIS